MRFISLLFVLLGVSGLAQAATITLDRTDCTSAVKCLAPAAGVEYVSFNTLYGRVSAKVNGVVYDSGARVPISVDLVFAINATLYASDGSQLVLGAAFKHWTTQTSSGRPTTTVQHYELLGGSLQ